MNFRSVSNDFSASMSASFMPGRSGLHGNDKNVGGAGNEKGARTKPRGNIIRSLLRRPHTPAICNRSNDDELQKLLAQEERENMLLADRARAIPWSKQTPRFRIPNQQQQPGLLRMHLPNEQLQRVASGGTPTSPRSVSPRAVSVDRPLQDTAMPSHKRPEAGLVAFRTPGRATPSIGQQALQLNVHGQIDRVQRLCEQREEQRSRALQQKMAVAASVEYDDRPPRPVTPRSSFVEFEEQLSARSAATNGAAPLPVPPGRPQSAIASQQPQSSAQSGCAGRTGDFFDDDSTTDEDDDGAHDQLSSSSLAATNGSPVSIQKRPRAESPPGERDAAGATSASHVPTAPIRSLKTDWGATREAAVFSAVRKLQETADRLNAVNVARTAQRIRQQHHEQAEDRTSFSHPLEPRSHTVRMRDPGAGAAAFSEEIEGIAGAGVGTGELDRARSRITSARTAYSSVASNRFGAPRVYCKQDFYEVQPDAFRHVATPRLAPRSHSSSLLSETKKRIRMSLNASNNNKNGYDGGDDDDDDDHNNGGPKKGEEPASSAAAGTTAALARPKTAAPTIYVRTNRAVNIIAATRKLGINATSGDNSKKAAADFDRQLGRDYLPVGGRLMAHSSFACGLSLEMLDEGDVAIGHKRSADQTPILRSRFEPAPPHTTKLRTNPSFALIHNRAATVKMSPPPAPRRPYVMGAPGPSDVIPETVVPDTRDGWSQAGTGGGGVSRTVIDCRSPLNDRPGLDLTHPKSIWNIKIPDDKKFLAAKKHAEGPLEA